MDNEIEEIPIITSDDLLREDKKNCVHVMFKKKGYICNDTRKNHINIKFKYKLDPFQEAACKCVEREESVLVAAHTSAGKTTVANYAIQATIDDGAKVIYTSPIKALSNQKYRDLVEAHGDKVGLATGDATYNIEAPILVMTTEVLRSILFRGSQLLREVKWIIFDEIHYMRDVHRGLVWEETIILLPDKIKYIFLSATIPNSHEFAKWIVSIKDQPCNVISTNYRPTPLRHYILPTGMDQIVLLQNESKDFNESNLKQVLKHVNNVLENDVPIQRSKKKRKTNSNNIDIDSDLRRLVNLCIKWNYLPIIVFIFSRKNVNESALLFENLDLTTLEEQKTIEELYKNALATLSSEDQKIPQFATYLEYLKKGIGIHHGGILPIIKEITEIMFQENLIKILLSTETFSMGINMPAKTVIFSSLTKFDGEKQRIITAGEYIQMSGRAGRRGIDELGISIAILNAKYDESSLKELYTGLPLYLNSQFHLTYTTILNMLRIQSVSIEYIVKRSFKRHQMNEKLFLMQKVEEKMNIEIQKNTITYMLNTLAIEVFNLDTHANSQILSKESLRLLPEKLVDNTETMYDNIEITLSEFCSNILNYFKSIKELATLNSKLSAFPKYLVKGRVVRLAEWSNNLYCIEKYWGYGILDHLESRWDESTEETVRKAHIYVYTKTNVDGTYIPHEKQDLEDYLCFGKSKVSMDTNEINVKKIIIDLYNIIDVTKFIVKFSTNLVSEVFNLNLGIKLLKLLEERNHELGYIDITQLNGTDMITTEQENIINEIKAHYIKIDEALNNIKQSAFYEHEYSKLIFRKNLKRLALFTEHNQLLESINQLQENQDNFEYHKLLSVLKKLGYVNENNTLTVKGIVCFDTASVDCIILGELLFNYSELKNLTPPYVAALFSILVADEKTKDNDQYDDPMLDELYVSLMLIIETIVDTSIDAGINIDKKAYMQKFQKSFMGPVFNWINKKSFTEIIEMYGLYEGTFIRTVKRIEEVLREAAAAARNMGQKPLEKLLISTFILLRRGIILTNSLYLVI